MRPAPTNRTWGALSHSHKATLPIEVTHISKLHLRLKPFTRDMPTTSLLSFALLCLACAAAVLGEPVYVDSTSSCTSSCGSSASPFPTIGEAIQAVSTGGQIIVRSGEYSGEGNFNLTVTSANTEIASESGNPDDTIIDCQQQGHGLFVHSSTFTISGITIRNCGSSESGGGMRINSTFTKFYDMKLTMNSASNHGGGVYIWSNTVFMYNTSITRNSADKLGGGVYLESANLQLFNTTVSDNSADVSGDEIYCRSASIQLDRDSAIGSGSTECPECSITYTDGAQFQCSPASRLTSFWASVLSA